MLTDWIMVLLTIVISALTYLVWKVYERIASLTGAMESHSEILLRIEAIRGAPEGTPIELVWWDPSIERPPVVREHAKPIELRRIYIYLPPNLRRNKPSLGKRLLDLFSLP